MTAALLGLAGVIVGALLGGVIEIEVERRRRSSQAQVAARLIDGDLEVAAAQLSSAIPEEGQPTWWQIDLPTADWRVNVKDLGFAARGDLVANVIRAFAILEGLEIDREKADGAPNPGELKSHLEKIQSVRKQLSRALEGGALRAPQFTVKVAAALTLFLVLFGLALAALAVSRPHLSATSIAAKLEQRLGPSSLADCDSSRGDWSCTVSELSRTRESCNVSSGARRTAARVAAPRVLADSAQPKKCREKVHWKVNIGRDQDHLVATMSASDARTAGARARAALAGAITEPKDSLLARAWNALFR
jgi:hypothetical protein